MSAARRRIASVLILTLVAAGCGLPSDGEPTAIAAEDIPQELVNLPGETIPPDEGTESILYLYNEGAGQLGIDTVVLVERNPTSVLRALLEWQAADSTDPDLTTNIPPGTGLIDITRDGEIAIINLSEEFGDTESESQVRAVAQIVYTLTSLSDFNQAGQQVMFQIDGVDSAVPDGERETQDTVGRDSYPNLRPVDE